MFFDAGKSLFVFYMMVSANFLGSLFGCRIQDILTNNMVLKHFLGLLTIYFFISLTSTPDPDNIPTPAEQLLKSAMIYLFFVISTKMNNKFWTPFIVLLGVLYMLNVFKDYNNKVKDPNKYALQPATIDTFETIIYFIEIIILIVGFLHYLGEKKLEYRSAFNYLEFFLGKPSCRRSTPTGIASLPTSRLIGVALTY